MANTTSLSFPNMFDIARNRVGILEDNQALVNRTRLLILTEPTELYNSPTFGVGLKRYLWQYNTANTKAIIQDRIVDQVREHEPYAVANKTIFADGLIFTEPGGSIEQDFNKLKMTVGLHPLYGDVVHIDIDTTQLQDIIDYASNSMING